MNESRDEFEARLRRTLHAAGAPRANPPAAGAVQSSATDARAPLPDWFVRRAQRDQPRFAGASQASAVHARTRGLPERLETESNARGSFGVRVERLAPEILHGNLRLDAVAAASGDSLALLTGDQALASFDPLHAVFLDIETTGLSGGAGTQVFQIGLLGFDGDAFQLWQGFLRSPDEAAALLHACAERVRRGTSLVSFFGKSFDRHRLEDQMRLHGVEPPFAGRAHLDLYHPCRRLYGRAFADSRLSTMERELCGVDRERDLSGAYAPEAWFDFLSDREHLLEAVFRHNRLDVLSLAVLCAHLSGVLDRGAGGAHSLAGPAQIRACALAEMFVQRRDWPRALEWSEQVLCANEGEVRALACRARALERLGRFDEARRDFTRLAAQAGDGVAAEALAEIALLALRAGDRADTLEACESAAVRAASSLTGTRRSRLERKLARVRSTLARRAAKSRG